MAYNKTENRIRFDFNNMMAKTVGEKGFTDRELNRYAGKAMWAFDYFSRNRGRDMMGWSELPYNQADVVDDILAAAKEIRDNFDFFVVLGIGGSATNDGGAGMLQALGFDLLDKDGNPIPFGAEGLRVLAKIENKNALPALKNCVIRAACDVTNPLCGENGCSAVFGPQKGATPEMIREMDGYMRNYAALTKELYPESNLDTPGAGAAGGLGFALGVFLHAELMPGIEIVMEETRLEEKIKNADFVVTGEGRLDAQTAMGKAPVGVAKLAKKYHKPVIAFAGGIEKGAEACNKAGITAFFPAVRGVTTLDEAMRPETAAENLAESAEQVFRLLTLR